MLQTSALNLGGSKEVKIGLKSFSTKLLEVCEGSKSVAHKCFGPGRVQGGEYGA